MEEEFEFEEKSNCINKEPWLAVILSTFLAGIGQIYSGRIMRGLVLICVQVSLSLGVFWFVLSLTGDIKIGAALFLSLIGIRIWNFFDAHRCAKKRNSEYFEIARKKTKDPWLAVYLSHIIPGLGQIYVRKRLIGIVFVICSFLVLQYYKLEYLVLFCLLWPVFSSLACYHAYCASRVRRETTKKQIFVIVFLILALNLVRLRALPLRKYLVEAFSVPTNSMAPTIIAGDKVLVTKLSKSSVNRGDIVVFKSIDEPYVPYIKRLVAFEGESVEIKNKNIFVNGKRLEIQVFEGIEYSSIDKFGIEGKPYIVPEDSIFVVGDNIKNSIDSRFWGALPKANLIGKAHKIYWPPKRMGPIK